MKKTINLTLVYKNYPGKWVALGNDEKTVFASGKTAKAVLQASRRNGHKEAILFRVPKKISLSISLAATSS